ncbi:hypothetical protein IL252_08670 [Halomicrobium sp. IBSBa]|uniref:DUF5784 family protein n=1 Tax=Halomicrobium sp. IBSBa TaxID=2778916 RepID=UPI001ABEFD31|nr:DUF5784 family protein [Halomicrobium sp. IBSBa]MBO4247884.1 hypothetical protein [Halomicrobium sp. IBSBa]
MAGPIRFRHSSERWNAGRVHDALYQPLDAKFGATMADPWYRPPDGYEARRIAMDNGDLALFCWSDADAYWLGNTETPKTLWRTNKCTFEEASHGVARWGKRELLAQLEQEDPWLAEYDHLAWFFLPVFFSKDGRESTRAFFRDHAGGFPDADREAALSFYEELLSTGLLDDHRYTMASKLGTSDGVDLTRMQATMGEFNAAKLLADAGHDFEPEVELGSGHALDFQVDDILVEVTRPQPTNRRKIDSPIHAVKASGDAKTRDQIAIHGNAALFVDCSSFPDDDWRRILGERPDVGHEPAVVFRMRPDGTTEGYAKGTLHLDVAGELERPAR